MDSAAAGSGWRPTPSPAARTSPDWVMPLTPWPSWGGAGRQAVGVPDLAASRTSSCCSGLVRCTSLVRIADMFCALIGATVSVLVLSHFHDRRMAALEAPAR